MKWKDLHLCIILCVCMVIGSIELSFGDFEREISNGPSFVKFFAPWCGHCKSLSPTWDLLSEKLTGRINIFKVDCTDEKNRELCQILNVHSFPTLILFSNGKMIQHDGKRTLEDLTRFALDSKPSSQIPSLKITSKEWASKSDVVELTGERYSDLLHGTWLIDFYKDSCPFCKDLIPEYEQLASDMKDKANISKANMISALGIFRAFQIRAVPTLLLFKGGRIYNLTYTGQNANDLREFIERGYNQHESVEIPTNFLELVKTPMDVRVKGTKEVEATSRMDKIDRADEDDDGGDYLMKLTEDLPSLFSNPANYITFSNSEAIMGLIAGAILFLLGFALGRLTAPMHVAIKPKMR